MLLIYFFKLTRINPFVVLKGREKEGNINDWIKILSFIICLREKT